MSNREVSLRVADARQRDVGHGKVRIDNDTMQKLGITAGDFVEIHGKKMTVAVAWPAYAEDQGQEIVRMDGLIRRNAGVADRVHGREKLGGKRTFMHLISARKRGKNPGVGPLVRQIDSGVRERIPESAAF